MFQWDKCLAVVHPSGVCWFCPFQVLWSWKKVRNTQNATWFMPKNTRQSTYLNRVSLTFNATEFQTKNSIKVFHFNDFRLSFIAIFRSGRLGKNEELEPSWQPTKPEHDGGEEQNCWSGNQENWWGRQQIYESEGWKHSLAFFDLGLRWGKLRSEAFWSTSTLHLRFATWFFSKFEK